MKKLLLLVLLVPRSQERPELWLYTSTNLWVDRNLETLEQVWRRAAKVGYTKVLLADSKFSKLGEMDKRYFAKIERVKKLAAELNHEIVPALFPIGYSNSMLWHDPNLAEGLPVFAGRGHRQVIAGYYDHKPEQARDWLASAAKVKGVVGIMYTTWESKYDDLEAFAKICRE